MITCFSIFFYCKLPRANQILSALVYPVMQLGLFFIIFLKYCLSTLIFIKKKNINLKIHENTRIYIIVVLLFPTQK